MNSLNWIFVCLCLLLADAGAQISGTFKISKISPTTGIEQVAFNADKTADVTFGTLIKTLTGNIAKWERVTNEARGTYAPARIEDMIAAWQAIKEPDADTLKRIKKLIAFKDQGYDLYVYVDFRSSNGNDYFAVFVRKGNELVDFDRGSIFRKPFWSF